MSDIPAEISNRRDAYCQQRGIEIEGELRGCGIDGFVWQTSRDSILKVFRRESLFQNEFSVYQRLQSHHIDELQGFQIPTLLHYDENFFVLELSYVTPPYILDFAAATLDQPPRDFNVEDPSWIAEKSHRFGTHWPEVVRLLDALRHIGIHYSDVHQDNIRFPP